MSKLICILWGRIIPCQSDISWLLIVAVRVLSRTCHGMSLRWTQKFQRHGPTQRHTVAENPLNALVVVDEVLSQFAAHGNEDNHRHDSGNQGAGHGDNQAENHVNLFLGNDD